MQRNRHARRVRALCIVPLLGAASAAHAELIYGITDTEPQQLVRFDSASPGNVKTIGPLTGLATGQYAAAIDFRPATGQLFLGAASSAGNAQVFTVDLSTGALTTLGPSFDPTGLGVPSFDFDPVTDEMRVVTTDGTNTNARFNPNTGVLIGYDTNLAFEPGDPNAGTNPPNVIGIAHSNNIAGASSSTLYAYDLDTDFLTTIGGAGGPGDGLMKSIGVSGFVTNSFSLGFDISGTTGLGYISASVDGLPSHSLFSVNLATGAITSIGAIGTPELLITDISIAVPEPTMLGLLAVGALGIRRRRW